jgi:hypothetical protein
MKDRRTAIIVLACVLVSAGLATYVLGPDPLRPAARVAEAAGDALVPATDAYRERARREAIRSELSRLVELQTAALPARGDFLPDDELQRDPFVLNVVSGRGSIVQRREGHSEPWWIGVLSHETSPLGEACAVALNREPTYAAGIPLKRSGRVRCSWDLATWLNRLW